jgi:fructose-specific phosphotransferase system IIC component
MGNRTIGFMLLLAGFVAFIIADRAGVNPCLSAVALVLAGIAILVGLAWRRAHQSLGDSRAELMKAAQMCVSCGYTIRAKTDRCPECGRPILDTLERD